MNHSEIIKEIAGRIEGLTQKEVKAVLDELKKVTHETLVKGEDVAIQGLGKFKAKVRASRQVLVNPKQPELGTKTTEEKVVPTFSASKEFKDVIANTDNTETK